MAPIELLEQLEASFNDWFGDVWPVLGEPFLRQEVARLSGPREVLRHFELELARTPPRSEQDWAARDLARHWMYGLAASADRKWEVTRQLLRRWEEDRELGKGGLFSGEAQTLFTQLHRTLGGLAHTIHGMRPPGDPDGALFRIDWVETDGKGCWEMVGAAEAFSLFRAAQDNAELVGGFPEKIASLVAGKIVAELRQGIAILPRLPIQKRSEHTTWLGWLRPVTEPQEAPPNWATPPERSSDSFAELEDRIIATTASSSEEAGDEPYPAWKSGMLHAHWAGICARIDDFPLLAELFGQSVECVRTAQALYNQDGMPSPVIPGLDDLGRMFLNSEDEPWERIGIHFPAIPMDPTAMEAHQKTADEFRRGVAQVAQVSAKVALQMIAFPVYVSFVLFPSTRQHSAPKAIVSHELWRQITLQRS